MRKSLRPNLYAATKRIMRGRITSLLVLIVLFFSVVTMPVIAHASGNSSVHGSEVLDLHENEAHQIDKADHSHSQGSDKEMPCHAVSHHHCSIALQLDAPRINLSALSKTTLLRPAATTPLASRSLAPPLDPPLA